MHFNNPDGALTELAIAEELRVNFIGVIKPVQNANYTWNKCTVQTLGSPNGEAVVVNYTPIPGALSGTPAHSALAVIFQIRTGAAGRKRRGRFYLCGVQQDSILNNILHPAAADLYTAIHNSLTNRYKSGGTAAINIGVMTRGDTGSFHNATSISHSNILGVQRRRNTGVGI